MSVNDLVLIVGERSDPHVEAIELAVACLGGESTALNSETLASARWRWSTDGFEVATDHGWRVCGRGWLRRLAPAGAHRGIELGSRQAAEASARLALIVSLSDSGIDWLTDHWQMARAENKLVMHRVAMALELRSPQTVVVAAAADIPEVLGDVVAVKPLGVGDFVFDNRAHAVHTRLVRRDDPDLAGLHLAPFIVQQAIAASRHLRVVTVGARAWACSLDATGTPVDWRAAADAHHRWEPDDVPQVELDALDVAAALEIGYSSQDWIVDDRGESWLVDVNPAGQWMFLPEPVSSAVTLAIAKWLVGHDPVGERDSE